MTDDLVRPQPPRELLDDSAPRFLPDGSFEEWMQAVFIAEGGPLHNPEHRHLEYARIGVLWTNVPNNRHGNDVLAECATGKPTALGKWARARMEAQLIEWFGVIPDFLITFSAPLVVLLSDRQFVALVDHELMHAGQARDKYGSPKFDALGRPSFRLRGHDVENFEEIVRRHGAKASFAFGLVKAAEEEPLVTDEAIARACGRVGKKEKAA